MPLFVWKFRGNDWLMLLLFALSFHVLQPQTSNLVNLLLQRVDMACICSHLKTARFHDTHSFAHAELMGSSAVVTLKACGQLNQLVHLLGGEAWAKLGRWLPMGFSGYFHGYSPIAMDPITFPPRAPRVHPAACPSEGRRVSQVVLGVSAEPIFDRAACTYGPCNVDGSRTIVNYELT